ncbi:multidrug effflux MFS transporter [Chryseobacterium culicis]|uniref:MFS transporter, DHA1 family, bicyclomycin/chloramphenicol resistance protein n=1 Tax=Chryseobacterium culicis TaxID=680127 RepID=A0A1H6IG31_CHRCI|nr:multidrug effflux MFS transporter [Chryseobacterium culicis]SEH47853.1 MFS transporter, DHA1 family, bicyclomycin/chloramphenicol resistance protein [Chryseobacterium culicis]
MKKKYQNTSTIHSQNVGKIFIPVLAGLMAFTSLSTDIYLPAMPTMENDLHGNIELTVTGFLVGFAVAQIIWGPISDKYGRKLPLIAGIFLFIIGSVGCALSDSMVAMVFWRIIQAFGACTGPMIARAMVRDVYEKTEAARKLSGLMILMAIAPIVGPLLGGQILKFASWHYIFWLLAVIGIVMLILVFFLPETFNPQYRSEQSIATAFSNYKKLISNKKFMKYTLCLTFFYMAAYGFIAGSPSVYISYFKVPEQSYGWLFALNVFGLIGFSLLNRKLVKTYSLDAILKVSTLVSMTSGLLMLVTVLNSWGGLAAVVIGVFFFFSMNGFIAACTTAAALDDVPEIAGSASALLGSMQYGSGIVSTLLLTFFGNTIPLTMSWIIAFFATLAALIMKPWNWKVQDDN